MHKLCLLLCLTTRKIKIWKICKLTELKLFNGKQFSYLTNSVAEVKMPDPYLYEELSSVYIFTHQRIGIGCVEILLWGVDDKIV